MDKISNFQTMWPDAADNRNIELCFVCKIGKYDNAIMEWIAKDIYNLFINGQFVAYGPARAAKGYSRIERLELKDYLNEDENTIAVYVQSNATNTLCFTKENPLFGAYIRTDGNVIRETSDFKCYQMTDRLQKVERMSDQRGFLEVYDMKVNRETAPAEYFPILEMKPVECPKLLERNVSYAKNDIQKAVFIKQGRTCKGQSEEWSNGLTGLLETGTELDCFARKDCDFLLSNELLSFHFKDEEPGERSVEEMACYVYSFSHVYCGKFRLKVRVSQKASLWLTYDDLLIDGYVKFNREQIIHGAKWTLDEGEYTLYTQEVYSAKYVQLITDGAIEIEDVSVICIENPDTEDFVIPSMKPELASIVEAARNSFVQNAYDIYTDCPSRERAGWLCDSYFMGKAEQFFTKDNKVEKNFLENYLLFENDKFAHRGIMPMCYPSYQKTKNSYIPSWILWYVLELEDYQDRTGDIEFIQLHRQRILDILDFFKGYENEYGLLENLEGWVFIEWSKATDFKKDVNFPTNMLYADTLRAAGRLLGDTGLQKKADALKKLIREMSYNGEVFLDHAVRVDGSLKLMKDDISELCQIFAVYFKIIQDDSKFEKNFRERFQNSRYSDKICPAALFIGGVLRLMVLSDWKEYHLLLKEAEERFLSMAERTGTLWELFNETSSCNHGFSSIVGKLVYEAAEQIRRNA